MSNGTRPEREDTQFALCLLDAIQAAGVRFLNPGQIAVDAGDLARMITNTQKCDVPDVAQKYREKYLPSHGAGQPGFDQLLEVILEIQRKISATDAAQPGSNPERKGGA